MPSDSIQKTLGITSGVGILVVALMLIIASALGMTMYGTIDTVKDESDQKVVDNINTSFIAFLVVGILFLVTYIGFFTFEAGIQQVCHSGANSPMCSAPTKNVTSYRMSVGVLAYVVAVVVIALCSEGIAMYSKISTYVGESDKQESNASLAKHVNNTMIAFLVIAVVFVVVYSIYISGAGKAGYDKFLSLSKAGGSSGASVEMTNF